MFIFTKLKNRIKNEQGQSVSELAVVAPFIMMLVIGGLLLGLIVYNQIVIITSANQGARLGAALAADEDVSFHTAQSRALSLAGDTLSHSAGQCSSVQATRNGDSFVVAIDCDYGIPIPFMQHQTISLSHTASYYIFE